MDTVQTKMQMHSERLEINVVGAMIYEPSIIPMIAAILRPECFYSVRIREVFKVTTDLDRRRKGIDLLTVVEELERSSKLQDVGGAYFVSKLTDGAYQNAQVQEHALIIYQFYLLREMSGLGMKLYNLCHEPSADALEIFSIIQKDLNTLDFISKNKTLRLGDAINEVLNDIKEVIENGIKPGLTSGLHNVDVMHTRQKQDFGLIAARPGHGKSAYMLTNAFYVASALKKPVAIFSLEMSTKKLVGRLMGSHSDIKSSDINKKVLTQSQFQRLGAAVMPIIDVPLFIDDDPFLDVVTLRSKIRRMKREFGIEEVYIDYLQLMAGEKRANRDQELSYISRNLKLIAKEEDVPIIALAQLSREVDKRAGHRPQLSDLRESGSLEQDADWVLFLMRPELYGVPDNTDRYEDETFNGRHLLIEHLMIVFCEKYREGALFKAALKFYGSSMRIENYDLQDNQLRIDAPAQPLIINDNFLNEKNPLDL